MNWIEKVKHWNHVAKYGFAPPKEIKLSEDKDQKPNDLETVGDLLAKGGMRHIGTIRESVNLDGVGALDNINTVNLDQLESLSKGEIPEREGCHVMVDIETWGTGPAAIPISIGAVKFYPNEKPFGWGEQFYTAIDPLSCAMVGLQVDMGTIMFWMDKKQRVALDEWLDQPKVDIHNALAGFAQWYGDKEFPTWSRGPDFDAVILNTAFKVIGMERPWGHQKNRDVRSIQGLMDWSWKAPGFEEAAGHKHNALADAIKQTWMIKGVIEALGLSLR